MIGIIKLTYSAISVVSSNQFIHRAIHGKTYLSTRQAVSGQNPIDLLYCSPVVKKDDGYRAHPSMAGTPA
jgi:hypothetical protein